MKPQTHDQAITFVARMGQYRARIERQLKKGEATKADLAQAIRVEKAATRALNELTSSATHGEMTCTTATVVITASR